MEHPEPGETTRGRSALRRAAAWLDASPSELVSLAMLLAGGAVLSLALWATTPPAGTQRPTVDGEPAAVALEGAPLLVHVAGAVRRPGLVEVADGARVADAIAATGGATMDADLDAVNLARPVTDGEHLVVPLRGVSSGGVDVPGTPGATMPDGRLDLNAATAQELEALPGIGPVLASRIIEHRDRHGRFGAVGELREVAGIGEKLFQDLAPLVAVR